VIQGYVYDSATSLGLEGVLVSAADISVTTDTAGFYFLEIEPGNYDLFYIKQGWHTHIIPSLAVADTMNIDIVLLHIFVDFPFEEDWASGDFETNGWTFFPAQGNWSINNTIGNLSPSAQFSWNPNQYNYSFELCSMEIDTRSITYDAWLEFDLQFVNFTATGNEKLRVDVWNGQEWIQLVEFANTQHMPWSRKSFNITGYATGQFTRVRFVAHGHNSFNIDFWRIDNISINYVPAIAVHPTAIYLACYPHYGTCVGPLTIYNNGQSTLHFSTYIQPLNVKSDEEIVLSSFFDSDLSQSPSPTLGDEPAITIGEDEVILHYDGPNYTGIGLTSGGTFHVATRFPASMVAPHSGKPLKSVDVYIQNIPGSIILKVWDGSTGNSPGVLIHQQTFSPVANNWNTININSSLPLSGNDLWVGYQVSHGAGQYPAGCDAGPANPDGDWISIDGASWEHLAGYGLNYNWNIRAKIQGRPYIVLQPNSGSIPPGSSMQLNVLLHVDINSWYYYCNITIPSNDPVSPEIVVPFFYEYINSIEQLNADEFYIISPVPSGSHLNIEFLHPAMNVWMLNHLGQNVLEFKVLEKSKIILDVHHLPSGLYFLQAEAKDGHVYSRKIVISR